MPGMQGVRRAFCSWQAFSGTSAGTFKLPAVCFGKYNLQQVCVRLTCGKDFNAESTTVM